MKLLLSVGFLVSALVGTITVDPAERPTLGLVVSTTTTTLPPTTTTTIAPTTTTNVPRVKALSAGPAMVLGDWDRLALCESDGNWALDALYDGGLQFHPDVWTAYVAAGRPYGLVGFPALAWQASREQQVTVATRVRDGVAGSNDPYLNAQGWRAWPVCSKRVGLR